MTPHARDRNLARVRRLTAFVAGAAVAATGVFAGLAASAPRHVAAATTTTATTQTQSQTAATQSPSIVVTPSSSPAVASSGGS